MDKRVRSRLSFSTGVGESPPLSTDGRERLAVAGGGAHDWCRAGTGLAVRSFGTH